MPSSSSDGRQVRLEPSGHTFTVADGETVLEAALRQGIGLPYGCRNGACGACKGILRSGELAYGDYQERALHPEEKAAGKAKEFVGDKTGNPNLEAEGQADQAKAKAKQAGDHVRDAADDVKEAFTS